MNIEYGSTGSRYGGSSIVFAWDPFAFKNTSDSEMRLKDRNHRDPEQAPRPERGDRYLLVGAAVGISLGSIAGYFIGSSLLGIGGFFLGLIAGAIVGGIIGVTAGNYMKKRIRTP